MSLDFNMLGENGPFRSLDYKLSRKVYLALASYFWDYLYGFVIPFCSCQPFYLISLVRHDVALKFVSSFSRPQFRIKVIV